MLFQNGFLGDLWDAHTHTRLTALFRDYLGEQEKVSGSGISWDICKSASHSRQIILPVPHHSSFLQAGCPLCHPTNSVKALKAPELIVVNKKTHFKGTVQMSHSNVM